MAKENVVYCIRVEDKNSQGNDANALIVIDNCDIDLMLRKVRELFAEGHKRMTLSAVERQI